jgi:hypothetical protein
MTEQANSLDRSKWPRMGSAGLVALMLLFHVAGIVKIIQVLDAFEVGDESPIRRFSEILIFVFALRVLACANYLLKRRWAVWFIAATYLGVYPLVPWLDLTMANTVFLFVLFIPFLLLVSIFERQYLRPWRTVDEGMLSAS